MNESYQYRGQPLTPKKCRKLITELFGGRDNVPVEDIKEKVEKVHLDRGGLPPTAKVMHPIRAALASLKRKGLVSNHNFGKWSISKDTGDIAGVVEISSSSAKVIGDGEGFVYVYYYPTYRSLAKYKNEEVWPCRIGITEDLTSVKVQGETGTALPEYPEIGLIIGTDKPETLKQAFCACLDLRGKSIRNTFGKDWFMTSTNEIEDIFQNILENTSDTDL